MIFKDRYVIEKKAIEPENKDKISISNEAYAIGEMIEKLMNKIELLRLK